MTSENDYKTPEGRAEITKPITAFLQEYGKITAIKHRLGNAENVEKAGVIPFWREVDEQGKVHYHFYLLRPEAKWTINNDMLNFQIAKGKRELLPDGDLEPLEVCALRELWEELGVVPEDIKNLYNAGRHTYISESSGQSKPVWIYAAELKSQKVVGKPLQGKKTLERAWCRIGKHAVADIRADHLPILESIENCLSRHLDGAALARGSRKTVIER